MTNNYETHGKEATIWCEHKGQMVPVLIDKKDLRRVKRLPGTWHIGYVSKRLPYVFHSQDGVTTYLHRVIMRPAPGMVVDHISGDTKDNRRSNLEVVTPAENIRRGFARRRKLLETAKRILDLLAA